MNAPRRIEPGPQIGAPPSLEQIPVGRLSVDPTYQRATDSDGSRRIILGMVKSWDWSLCQPLVVTRRADGSLWVLDGQHRLAGAVERGDIQFVPCVILSSLDHEAEARTFVELNTRRQKLSQGQIFHGMLAAGDAEALVVQQLLDDTGWRVCRHSNTAAFKPGDLECAPMLVRMVASKSEPATRFALTVLRTAYPETAIRQSATLIKAVVELFNEVTALALIDTIDKRQPQQWLSRGAALQEKNSGLSIVAAIAQAMLHACTGEPEPSPRSVTGILPPAIMAKPVPAPRRPASPPPERMFGTSGKGWCDQCDQLRSREYAAACINRFCKLRGHA